MNTQERNHQLDATIDVDCAGPTATVDVRREGSGRDRIVVLVDGDVVQILDVEGTDGAEVDLDVDDGATLTVTRAGTGSPIATSRVSCDGGGGGTAGLVAASLVVVAVLASAAGVLPGPLRNLVAGG